MKTQTENRNCGECLFERTEIVQLIDGVCPKCGADYNSSFEPMLPFEGERAKTDQKDPR
jgi:hypothetical protein